MAPVVFVDSRPRISRAATTTILSSATSNETWLIKPRSNPEDDVFQGRVELIDPRDLPGAERLQHRFRAVYRHYSTNPVAYERACFERFLLTHLWSDRFSYGDFWHFDTDALAAMPLADLVAEERRFQLSCGLPTGLQGKMPSATVSQSFQTSDVASRFVDFMMSRFFSDPHLNLEGWFLERTRDGLGGGVSDMTAWGQFIVSNPDITVFDSFSSTLRGRILVDTTYQLRQQLDAMNLDWSEGRLYLRSRNGRLSVMRGESILGIAAIHMAGADKGLIFPLSNGKSVRYMGLQHQLRRAKFRALRRSQHTVRQLQSRL